MVSLGLVVLLAVFDAAATMKEIPNEISCAAPDRMTETDRSQLMDPEHVSFLFFFVIRRLC